MLEFRTGPRPRNYLARREQMRLFVLVMALMTILWVALEARDPQYYQWICSGSQTSETGEQSVDTRFVPTKSNPDDSFIFSEPGEGSDEPTKAVSGALTKADLDAVRDDEPFHAGEQDAWFKLFDRLHKTDSEVLAKESIGPVTFVQLFRQPREYRAELVTLSGILRRTERLTAPRNDVGIETYYRTWLFPTDNPENPIVVYTLTVPDGFPQGMTIEEPVQLEGFFFKRWPYAARDTIRSAPVALAKSLRWVAAGPQKSAPPMSPAWIVAVAAAVAVAVAAFVGWKTRRTTRDAQPARLSPDQTSSDLDSVAIAPLRLVTDADAEEDRQ